MTNRIFSCVSLPGSSLAKMLVFICLVLASSGCATVQRIVNENAGCQSCQQAANAGCPHGCLAESAVASQPLPIEYGEQVNHEFAGPINPEFAGPISPEIASQIETLSETHSALQEQFVTLDKNAELHRSTTKDHEEEIRTLAETLVIIQTNMDRQKNELREIQTSLVEQRESNGRMLASVENQLLDLLAEYEYDSQSPTAQ